MTDPEPASRADYGGDDPDELPGPLFNPPAPPPADPPASYGTDSYDPENDDGYDIAGGDDG